jgi:hypothetical protein
MNKSCRIAAFILCIFPFQYLLAQKNNCSTIVYEQLENGKLLSDKTTTVKCNNAFASIQNSSTTESFFVDYIARNTIKISSFSDKKYAVFTSFDSLPKSISTNEIDTILGFVCRKLKYEIFSNHLEVWITDKANCKGSPTISFVPKDALVLKYVMNGSRTVLAKSIKTSDEKIEQPKQDFIKVDDPQYAAAQIKSRFTSIPIFNHQQINFENDIKNPIATNENVVYRFSKGNVILKKIKLPKDNSKGSFFVQITDWSNGDAYDRVGSVFTFSAKKEKSMLDALQKGMDAIPFYTDHKNEKYQGIVATPNYSPAIELMRFFTPFGVNYFNKKRIIAGYHWSDSVVYKQDVTALIPTDENEIWIGAYIGNYDKGGHKVSLVLDFYPESEQAVSKKFIAPLFNTVNILEAAGQNYGKLFENDSLNISFEVPDSLKDLQLLFTTTGHGGWENGDEFNPKLNQIFVDGKAVFQITPWRTDCGTYRLHNPASGNFPDGLSSSDFSRSKWCPGALTPPYLIPLKKLAKGKHTLQVMIDQGKNEGGSFSHWCISGVLVGNKK